MTHADKSCWVDATDYKRIWHHTHVEAVVLAHGRIRGFWRSKRRARGLTIDVQPFGETAMPRYVERGIEQQAEAVGAFIGLPLRQLEVHTRT